MDQVFTTEQIVKKYIELRDYKERLAAEFKTKVEPVDAAMEALSNIMLDKMNQSGETSKRTEAGTAFIKENTFIGVADWDISFAFIQQNGLWNFLTKALNKTAVIEYTNEHNVPPPGVNITTKREVQFRKPTK